MSRLAELRQEVDLRLGAYAEVLPSLAGLNADLVILDLPYGITSAQWDGAIDLEVLWELLRPTMASSAVVCAFAVQPFAAHVVVSNPTLFKYELIWRKPNGTNPYQARQRPMRNHENILIFGGSHYSPQMEVGNPYKWDSVRSKGAAARIGGGGRIENEGTRFPRSVLAFPQDRGLHPTQKPVELCRWLIRSYSPSCGCVLDPTMGSGTSGVAATLEGRSFVGIERDADFFGVAQDRTTDEPSV
tara:strand:+ start:383 stop:1114 length:732 start_codon:yes stop_codon:yes gene_type:complete